MVDQALYSPEGGPPYNKWRTSLRTRTHHQINHCQSVEKLEDVSNLITNALNKPFKKLKQVKVEKQKVENDVNLKIKIKRNKIINKKRKKNGSKLSSESIFLDRRLEKDDPGDEESVLQETNDDAEVDTLNENEEDENNEVPENSEKSKVNLKLFEANGKLTEEFQARNSLEQQVNLYIKILKARDDEIQRLKRKNDEGDQLLFNSFYELGYLKKRCAMLQDQNEVYRRKCQVFDSLGEDTETFLMLPAISSASDV